MRVKLTIKTFRRTHPKLFPITLLTLLSCTKILLKTPLFLVKYLVFKDAFPVAVPFIVDLVCTSLSPFKDYYNYFDLMRPAVSLYTARLGYFSS